MDTKKTKRCTSNAPHLGTPLDLYATRKILGLTKKQMAERLTETLAPIAEPSGKYEVWYSRVHEWENGTRSVPDYVYLAAAQLLIDKWKADRGDATGIIKKDIAYAGMFNPAYADLLAFARGVRDEVLVKALATIEKGFMKSFVRRFGSVALGVPRLIHQ